MNQTQRTLIDPTILSEINKEIEAGFIAVQKHPTDDLCIYNYTQRAQWEQHWTPATKMCRGLILDSGGFIHARPFEKFFNYEQVLDQIPDEPFEVFEKMDGSLGILYWASDGPAIATRGSFTSPQAIEATKLLRTQYPNASFLKSFTYLFEIILPWNRIVVDYGQESKLILLVIVDTESNPPINEVSYNAMNTDNERFLRMSIVKRYDGMNDFKTILKYNQENFEGFVIKFRSGFRCKVKLAEYVRLHRLLTGVSEKTVWTELRERGNINALIEKVPDEFMNWVESTERKLRLKYKEIEQYCLDFYRPKSDFPGRKEAAEYYTKSKYSGISFAMFDDKDYVDKIWRMIKPESNQVFKLDKDG